MTMELALVLSGEMEEVAGTLTQYFCKSGMCLFIHFAPLFGQTGGVFSTVFMESGLSSPLTMTNNGSPRSYD